LHDVQNLQTIEFDDVAEAESYVPFPLLAPEWVPDGYELKVVRVTLFSEDSGEVHLVYAAGTSGFELVENPMGDELGTGQLYDSDDAMVRDVVVGTSPGMLTTHKTGHRTLRWHTRDKLFILRGPLSEADIFSIAESLQPR